MPQIPEFVFTAVMAGSILVITAFFLGLWLGKKAEKNQSQESRQLPGWWLYLDKGDGRIALKLCRAYTSGLSTKEVLLEQVVEMDAWYAGKEEDDNFGEYIRRTFFCHERRYGIAPHGTTGNILVIPLAFEELESITHNACRPFTITTTFLPFRFIPVQK